MQAHSATHSCTYAWNASVFSRRKVYSLVYTQRLAHSQLWKLLYLLCDANTSRNWRCLRQSCTRSRLTRMRICMLIITTACRASPGFCITSESTLQRSSVRPYQRAILVMNTLECAFTCALYDCPLLPGRGLNNAFLRSTRSAVALLIQISYYNL